MQVTEEYREPALLEKSLPPELSEECRGKLHDLFAEGERSVVDFLPKNKFNAAELVAYWEAVADGKSPDEANSLVWETMDPSRQAFIVSKIMGAGVKDMEVALSALAEIKILAESDLRQTGMSVAELGNHCPSTLKLCQELQINAHVLGRYLLDHGAQGLHDMVQSATCREGFETDSRLSGIDPLLIKIVTPGPSVTEKVVAAWG